MKKEIMVALLGVLSLWATWVSGTLVKLEAEVAVMRYKLFNVAKRLPSPTDDTDNQPMLAEPIPFKHWLQQKGEKK